MSAANANLPISVSLLRYNQSFPNIAKSEAFSRVPIDQALRETGPSGSPQSLPRHQR